MSSNLALRAERNGGLQRNKDGRAQLLSVVVVECGERDAILELGIVARRKGGAADDSLLEEPGRVECDGRLDGFSHLALCFVDERLDGRLDGFGAGYLRSSGR